MNPRRRATEVPPRLLISIRHVGELAAALRGADIIDVKEPSRGPLGMADDAVIQEIATNLDQWAPIPTGLSVALGDLQDWPESRESAGLPARVRWAKVGLAGGLHFSDWRAEWLRLRSAIDAASGRPLEWIAVAYADAVKVAAPGWQEVLRAARETQCAGLLIDTATKSSGSLLDWLSPVELVSLVQQSREACLPLALAGKVTVDDLTWLRQIDPDIIGVRSAVCQRGDRTQAVSPVAVEEFRRRLSRTATVDHTAVPVARRPFDTPLPTHP